MINEIKNDNQLNILQLSEVDTKKNIIFLFVYE
jgi:hypothetical protein